MRSGILESFVLRVRNLKRRNQKLRFLFFIIICILVFALIYMYESRVVNFSSIPFILSLFISIVIFLGCLEKKKLITKNEVLAFLEISYLGSKDSSSIIKKNPFLLKEEDSSLSQEDQSYWLDEFKKIYSDLRVNERRRCLVVSKVLGILMILVLGLGYYLKPYGDLSFIRSIFLRHFVWVEVEDIDENTGIRTQGGEVQKYSLNSFFTKKIVLPPKNIVTVKLNSSRGVDEVGNSVDLISTEDNSLYQSFRLSCSSEERLCSVSFSVNKNLYLKIPGYSGRRLVLFITTSEQVPSLKLSTNLDISDYISDDTSVPLQIEATSKVGLTRIWLELKANKRSHEELVSMVLNKDTFKYSDSYPLVFEPYIEEDTEEFEVRALASDQSTPLPLIGASDPLIIKVASSYGLYKNVLEKLKQLKSQIEENILSKGKNDIKSLMSTIIDKSTNLSFFDFWDRQRLEQIEEGVARLSNDPISYKVLDEIDDFLFEHEMLDFRERDRDFFVATRILSKLIKDRKKLDHAFLRLDSFLEERDKIWQMRVQRINESLSKTPPMWSQVKNKIFHQDLSKLKNLESIYDNPKTESMLNKLNNSYKSWIEELEKYEDEAREAMEKKREKSMASLKEELRELQKQQDEISKDLDKATTPERKTEISSNEASIRLKQKANISGVKGLKMKISSFMSKSKTRLDFAEEAMNKVIEQLDSKDYLQAESASDMAARLLRDAQTAAEREQKQARQQRSRRRVSSSNYHGKSIIGQDIQIIHRYSVDRRYRENILEDIQNELQNSSELDTDSKDYLKKYLKQVVR